MICSKLKVLASLLAATTCAAAQSTHWYILTDLSDSTSANTLWAAAAERQVFSQLQFGDTITVLPVRGSDLLSAPLFDETIPLILPSDGLGKANAAKRKRREVRATGWNSIEAALTTQPRSNATALIATLGRVRIADRTRVLVLSDGLESGKLLARMRFMSHG